VVKTTGYIEIPHTKAKNIACGFNRRTQRISIAMITLSRINLLKTYSPWLKPRAILKYHAKKAKTIACGLTIGRQYK
jgi:hypothetical protein